jgi:hypothetical protein
MGRGWVAAEFVTPQDGIESLPIAAAPTPTPTAGPTEQEASESEFIDVDALPIWY